MEDCKLVPTPVEVGTKLLADENGKSVDNTLSR
jgi:hypothetical protein